MKKILLFTFSILTLIFTISCEKDEDILPDIDQTETPDSNKNEGMISDDFVPIDWNKVKMLHCDTTNNLVTLSLNEQTRSMRPGQVISVANDTMSRIFVVQDVTLGNDNITLRTIKGDLCDIFANTDIILSSEQNAQRSGDDDTNVYYPVKVTFKDDNGSIVTASRITSDESTRLTGHLWKWDNDRTDIVFYNKNGAKVYLENPNCSVNLDLKMNLNFGGRTKPQWLANGYKRFKSEALEVSASLIGFIDNSSILKAQVNGKVDYSEDEDENFKHNVFKPCNLTFNVGGVLIVVTLSADMFRGASITAEGAINAFAGYEQKITGTASLEWKQAEGKLNPSTSFEYVDRKIPPTVEGKGSVKAEAWFYPRIYLSLYGIIGPSFDIKPYIGSEIEAGFRKSLGGNSDYMAWQLRNYMGLELAGGLSLKFMNYEVEHKETCKLKVFEKDLYLAPAAIELRDSPSAGIEVGQSGLVEFNVYDKDMFGNKVNSILPAIAQFEAEGDCTPTTDLAKNGVVSTNWTPSAEDEVLSATLYDVDGDIIDQARVNTQLKDAGSLTHTEYYDDNDIVSFSVTNNLPTYSFMCYYQDSPHIKIPIKISLKTSNLKLNKDDDAYIYLNYKESDKDLIETINLEKYIASDKNGNKYWKSSMISIEDTLITCNGELYRRGINPAYPPLKFDIFAKLSIHKQYPDNNYEGEWVKQSYLYNRSPKVVIKDLHLDANDDFWHWKIKIDGAFWMWKKYDFINGTDIEDCIYGRIKQSGKSYREYDVSDITLEHSEFYMYAHKHEINEKLYYEFYMMGEKQHSSNCIVFSSDSKGNVSARLEAL